MVTGFIQIMNVKFKFRYLALRLLYNKTLTQLFKVISHDLPYIHPLTHLPFPVSKPELKLDLHSGNTRVHLLKYYSSRSKPNNISSIKILSRINLYFPYSFKALFTERLFLLKYL